ncbi:NAD(P)H-binding protein [Catellatospora sp. NPDC049609]|uniref:NAD(P)H-binding protein n=1 Tax=Catellatospora sp. NPDC049609 TaxID=3155505 RepID=UPI0034428E65
MTILVTGANGNVSSALLATLAADPAHQVRALVRDPAKAPAGVEVAVGDLAQPHTLTGAFAGVDTLWLLTAMGPDAPHASSNAVWAARQAGVRHIVRLSAIGAAHDAPTRNGRLHALSDTELQASGIGWTVIRPAFFLQNLLGSVQSGVLHAATGDGRLSPIDVRDIADFGARVLAEPSRHARRVYTITGPESLSMRAAADRIGASYQHVPAADVVAGMRVAGLSDWIADVTGEYLDAYAAGWGDLVTRDFAEVTGRPARDFVTFAREHGLATR